MATAPKTTRKAASTKKTSTTTRRKTAAKPKAPTEADKVLAETIAAAEIEAEKIDVDVTVDEAPETESEAEVSPVEMLDIVDQPELKKRELVELAVERSGVKKRDAKPAIEAALAVLGEAIAEGRELNLRPFGKLKVTRMKKGEHGQIINARVRQPQDDVSNEISDMDPLAHAAE